MRGVGHTERAASRAVRRLTLYVEATQVATELHQESLGRDSRRSYGGKCLGLKGWRPRRLTSAPASVDTVAAFRPWRDFRPSVARGRRGHHRREPRSARPGWIFRAVLRGGASKLAYLVGRGEMVESILPVLTGNSQTGGCPAVCLGGRSVTDGLPLGLSTWRSGFLHQRPDGARHGRPWQP